ncbi:MAG: rRNA pseudouridine synthase [Synergistaceae bacterium]|jgi:23S rRNA pseudouridine2605 synthase|nr:rRNA pseudouridine synthase [Synergistaceae bacterium]
MRLNAFLADCGTASRRKSEELIHAGRVKVNGKIVLAPYFPADPDKDVVEVDGVRVLPCPKVYIVMNKPSGVVCAVSDKHDPVVMDLLPEKYRAQGVFPVGRLDRESEGLLILTNDGEFAQNVLHPSKGVVKEYEALLDGEIDEKRLNRWREGFEIQGRKIAPLSIAVMIREPRGRWVRLTIGEGLKREVRVMAKQAGFTVLRLIRRRIGVLTLMKLQKNQFVELSFSDLYTKIFEGGSI